MADHFTQEEADAILRKAVERDPMGDEMSRDQLASIAHEMGISADALGRAEAAWREERREQSLRAAFEGELRSGFKSHVAQFLLVNAFLFLINFFATPDYFWFVYPLLGWGLGLAIQGAHTYRSSPEREEEFRKWLEKRARPAVPGPVGAPTYAAPDSDRKQRRRRLR
jgi:hypothetical protein